MRVRRIALFSFTCALVWSALPMSALANGPGPTIYDTRLIGMSPIATAPYGTFQTAIRTSDTPTLQVFVHSMFGTPPTISADLTAFGLSDSATTSGRDAGPAARYPPAYFYNFGPMPPRADIADGVYGISLTATDETGVSTSTVISVRMDNVAPAISLSAIDFSSDTPQEFDDIYLSGSSDGTGSAIKIASVEQALVNAQGRVLPYGYSSSIAQPNMAALNAALASSTDGDFVGIPIKLFWGDASVHIEDATSLRVVLSAYDEAGFLATTTLTVPFPTPDPCATPGSCASNVLFLPGIQGSRLYEGPGCGGTGEEKLWEPLGESLLRILRGAGDDKVERLFLTESGQSSCADIYTKTGDIIDSVAGTDLYRSFIGELDELKTAKTINDWKSAPYDWRFSLPDLLDKGAEHDGKIYYGEATSTPYIEQTLRFLAASSKTGKVTIVAHSNGGLVAKALLNQLGSETSKSLVDKIIMVGAPQSGAPESLGVLLLGHNAGIYEMGFPIVSNAVAREFSQNAPMAYHLLPSEEYLESAADDPIHPVARFAGDGYAKELDAYGATILNKSALDDFLLAEEGGRVNPEAGDLSVAEVLNASLIDYANSQHAALDAWVPPAEIEVSQIAGWGADTLAGIDFYTLPAVSALSSFEPVRAYRPIFTEDGDGTVPVPSALMMASSTNVKRYWVNLDSFFRDASIKHTHKDLFEIFSLEDLIKDIVTNSTSTLPRYISTDQPPSKTQNKRLTFFLHSPLTLQLTDSSGNTTGLAEDGSTTEDILNSTYGEFGEVKYITVPGDNQYELTMYGQADGTFSLDVQESVGGVVTASSTIANVPTTANTLASITISGGLDTLSALTVDENGDGTSIVNITPEIGEIVSYEPPAPVLVPEPTEPIASSAQGAGGGHGGGTAPAIVATSVPAATSTDTNLATTTQTIATATSAVKAPKPIQIKNKSVKPQESAAPAKKPNQNLSQTASVFEASQQSVIRKLGAVLYNGLHGFWAALKKLF